MAAAESAHAQQRPPTPPVEPPLVPPSYGQPPLQPMAPGHVPMAGQVPGASMGADYAGAGAVAMSADDRKFAAADADGDGFVSEQEANDYLTYHAAADADGDGTIDLRELVRYLKPLDDANQRAAYEWNARFAEMDGVRQQQQQEAEALRRQLVELGASLGVSEQQVNDAVNTKSSLCSVM